MALAYEHRFRFGHMGASRMAVFGRYVDRHSYKLEDIFFSFALENYLKFLTNPAGPVSYTHLDVYKRQLLYVAQDKLQPEQIPEILAARDRTTAGPTAPPCGLDLNRVFYGEGPV